MINRVLIGLLIPLSILGASDSCIASAGGANSGAGSPAKLEKQGRGLTTAVASEAREIESRAKQEQERKKTATTFGRWAEYAVNLYNFLHLLEYPFNDPVLREFSPERLTLILEPFFEYSHPAQEIFDIDERQTDTFLNFPMQKKIIVNPVYLQKDLNRQSTESILVTILHEAFGLADFDQDYSHSKYLLKAFEDFSSGKVWTWAKERAPILVQAKTCSFSLPSEQRFLIGKRLSALNLPLVFLDLAHRDFEIYKKFYIEVNGMGSYPAKTQELEAKVAGLGVPRIFQYSEYHFEIKRLENLCNRIE